YNQPLPVISPEEMLAFEQNRTRISALLTRTESKEHAFWIQLLENLSVEVGNKQGYVKVEKGEMSAQDINNARDQQMADNAIWLLNGPFKEKKIIL
ncbi:hypothetical protein MMA22_23675, partial [Salmonella enterica]|nr:hypothetical protein [Salmonella enterica]